MVKGKADLLIKNGEICTGQGRYKGDILVDAGKIVAVGDSSIFPQASRVIDVRGKIVLPGMIYSHCHFRDPGYTHKEDFYTGTRAAAAGGATMAIAMTNVKPAPLKLDIFERWKEDAGKKCVIDFALYGGYGTSSKPSDIADLAKAGAIGIKVFNFHDLRATYPHVPELAVTDWGIMHEIFEGCVAAGIPVAVHPDLSSWVNRLVVREYLDKGKNTPADYHEAATRGITFGHGMVMGAMLCVYIARLTGVKLLVVHLGAMCDEGYDVIRIARERGMKNVFTEMEAIDLFMEMDRVEKLGIYCGGWKGRRNREEGWKAINDGTIDLCVIEHAPHARQDVELGRNDMWQTHTGPLGSQEFLPLMLTAVNQGKLTLEKLVQMTSENPARFFGMYPTKGSITAGADADFTIIDLKKRDVIRTENVVSKCGWTPWEGYKVKGVVVDTIVRGREVVRDGQVIGEAGYGKFIPGTGVK